MATSQKQSILILFLCNILTIPVLVSHKISIVCTYSKYCINVQNIKEAKKGLFYHSYHSYWLTKKNISVCFCKNDLKFFNIFLSFFLGFKGASVNSLNIKLLWKTILIGLRIWTLVNPEIETHNIEVPTV